MSISSGVRPLLIRRYRSVCCPSHDLTAHEQHLDVHVLAGLWIQQPARIEDARVPVGKGLHAFVEEYGGAAGLDAKLAAGSLAGDDGGFAVSVGAGLEAFEAIALPAFAGAMLIAIGVYEQDAHAETGFAREFARFVVPPQGEPMLADGPPVE